MFLLTFNLIPLKTYIHKISNVFGQDQPIGRGQSVITERLHAIKNQGRFTLYGKDRIIIDFLYIEDHMTALTKCVFIDRTELQHLVRSLFHTPSCLYKV